MCAHYKGEDTDKISLCPTLLDIVVSQATTDVKLEQLSKDVRDAVEASKKTHETVQDFIDSHSGDAAKIIIWLVGTLFTLTGIVLAVLKFHE